MDSEHYLGLSHNGMEVAPDLCKLRRVATGEPGHKLVTSERGKGPVSWNRSGPTFLMSVHFRTW